MPVKLFPFKMPAGLTGAVTVKQDGVSWAYHTAETPEETEMITKSRSELLKQTGFESLITLKQTHSDIIHALDQDNLSKYKGNPLIEGDALHTNIPSVLLGVLTADCLPIILADKKSRFTGIAHAGWKGIQQKICTKLIAEMIQSYSVQVSGLTVTIGPHIKQCCYEVGKEFLKVFPEECFIEKTGSLFFSMEKALRLELKTAGVKEAEISSSGLCTFCSKEPVLYSYRRGEKKDRVLTVCGIK